MRVLLAASLTVCRAARVAILRCRRTLQDQSGAVAPRTTTARRAVTTSHALDLFALPSPPPACTVRLAVETFQGGRRLLPG
jgi:hypothetical protein